ncbi:MAG: C40 family peptidase [Oscillospiraceae bacterium]|nr:C40 family peptidase [Oscillospiraceae bacterium]
MKKILLIIAVALLFAGCSEHGNRGEYGEYEFPAPNSDNADNLKENERVQRQNGAGAPLADEKNSELIVSPFEENQIVLTAQSLLGVEFNDGGSSPDEGFDNSGFIHYVLRQNGYVNSPRGLQEQAVMGNAVGSISELISGDLVFFSDNGERAAFGGIYIGDGLMISCRMPGEAVREVDITVKYYMDSFFTGVRVM